MSVPIEKWGKDHWSLVAYIETRCVDYGGVLEPQHMRCNPANHPEYAVVARSFGIQWSPTYGTRLHGFFEHQTDTSLILSEHDDWDCLEDIQAAGLVKATKTKVVMTDSGLRVAEALRKFKAKGGMFADFTLQTKSHRLKSVDDC